MLLYKWSIYENTSYPLIKSIFVLMILGLLLLPLLKVKLLPDDEEWVAWFMSLIINGSGSRWDCTI